MRNSIIIVIGLIVLICSNYLGHTNPPFSISFTPVLIGSLTYISFFRSNFSLRSKFLIPLIFLILNDLLIRKYAGGTHDSEGNGWIIAFQGLGIIISEIIVITYFFKNRSVWKKILLNQLIVVGAFSLYSSYFFTYGLSTRNVGNYKIEKSIESNLFISAIEIIDSSMNDSLSIANGFAEKETWLNHKSLVKKIDTTDRINIVLVLNGILLGYDNIYYQVDEEVFASYLSSHDSLLQIIAKNTGEDIQLKFKRDNKELIKKVTIKYSP